MSESSNWKSIEVNEASNETRSSQETIYQSDNYDANEVASSSVLYHQKDLIDQNEDVSPKNTSNISLQSNESFGLNINLPVVMDEETQMTFGTELAQESPRDIISPGDPEDASSPFEAMESDVDSIQSSSNIGYRRPLPPDRLNQFSTTTPGGSSDDDYSEDRNVTVRIKRRKKHLRNGDGLSYWSSDLARYNSPASSQIPSPSLSVTDLWPAETEDSSACPTPFQSKNNVSYNNSDLNLHATMNARRLSNASETSVNTPFNPRYEPALVTRTGRSETSIFPPNFHYLDFFSREQVANAVIKAEITEAPLLTINQPQFCSFTKDLGIAIHNDEVIYKDFNAFTLTYPSSTKGCSLEIVVQPEPQHRARYLTEGSRGPVKDSSQQGFPQLKVKGHSGKATLHIFVISETGERLKPHGFYQACKVSGRNTSPCREVDVDGTIVLSMLVDTSEVISVDCVGILKLRNADVQARFGLQRPKKRSQNVRLVFRIFLHENSTNTLKLAECPVLQVTSNRISCTQPPGHPEIIKKSLDRCSVIGGAEMFIIGRNFRKGIKVIFQDPEEADGSHWSAAGQVDRNTFNQAHLVVEVPPYHNTKITKPVNVQVYIEYNRRKCDPHSFTYDPIIQKSSSLSSPNSTSSIASSIINNPNPTGSEDGDNSSCVDNHVKKFLSTFSDRHKFVSWFSELLMSVDVNSDPSSPKTTTASSDLPYPVSFSQMIPKPVTFTQVVPEPSPNVSVEKPTPKVHQGDSNRISINSSSFTNQFGVNPLFGVPANSTTNTNSQLFPNFDLKRISGATVPSSGKKSLFNFTACHKTATLSGENASIQDSKITLQSMEDSHEVNVPVSHDPVLSSSLDVTFINTSPLSTFDDKSWKGQSLKVEPPSSNRCAENSSQNFPSQSTSVSLFQQQQHSSNKPLRSVIQPGLFKLHSQQQQKQFLQDPSTNLQQKQQENIQLQQSQPAQLQNQHFQHLQQDCQTYQSNISQSISQRNQCQAIHQNNQHNIHQINQQQPAHQINQQQPAHQINQQQPAHQINQQQPSHQINQQQPSHQINQQQPSHQINQQQPSHQINQQQPSHQINQQPPSHQINQQQPAHQINQQQPSHQINQQQPGHQINQQQPAHQINQQQPAHQINQQQPAHQINQQQPAHQINQQQPSHQINQQQPAHQINQQQPAHQINQQQPSHQINQQQPAHQINQQQTSQHINQQQPAHQINPQQPAHQINQQQPSHQINQQQPSHQINQQQPSHQINQQPPSHQINQQQPSHQINQQQPSHQVNQQQPSHQVNQQQSVHQINQQQPSHQINQQQPSHQINQQQPSHQINQQQFHSNLTAPINHLAHQIQQQANQQPSHQINQQQSSHQVNQQQTSHQINQQQPSHQINQQQPSHQINQQQPAHQINQQQPVHQINQQQPSHQINQPQPSHQINQQQPAHQINQQQPSHQINQQQPSHQINQQQPSHQINQQQPAHQINQTQPSHQINQQQPAHQINQQQPSHQINQQQPSHQINQQQPAHQINQQQPVHQINQQQPAHQINQQQPAHQINQQQPSHQINQQQPSHQINQQQPSHQINQQQPSHQISQQQPSHQINQQQFHSNLTAPINHLAHQIQQQANQQQIHQSTNQTLQKSIQQNQQFSPVSCPITQQQPSSFNDQLFQPPNQPLNIFTFQSISNNQADDHHQPSTDHSLQPSSTTLQTISQCELMHISATNDLTTQQFSPQQIQLASFQSSTASPVHCHISATSTSPSAANIFSLTSRGTGLQKSCSNISLDNCPSLSHNTCISSPESNSRIEESLMSQSDEPNSRVMESGLSLGFDNHFNLDDDGLSKCPSSIQMSTSPISSLMVNDNDVLRSYMPQISSQASSISFSGVDHQATVINNFPITTTNPISNSSCFTTSTNIVTSSEACYISNNDVEMLDKEFDNVDQTSPKQFLHQTNESFEHQHQELPFLSSVVDANMFLVDPNVVVKPIHSKHSSVASPTSSSINQSPSSVNPVNIHDEDVQMTPQMSLEAVDEQQLHGISADKSQLCSSTFEDIDNCQMKLADADQRFSCSNSAS